MKARGFVTITFKGHGNPVTIEPMWAKLEFKILSLGTLRPIGHFFEAIAEVEASESGSQYNLPAGTKFYCDQFDPRLPYAIINSAVFTGGIDVAPIQVPPLSVSTPLPSIYGQISVTGFHGNGLPAPVPVQIGDKLEAVIDFIGASKGTILTVTRVNHPNSLFFTGVSFAGYPLCFSYTTITNGNLKPVQAPLSVSIPFPQVYGQKEIDINIGIDHQSSKPDPVCECGADKHGFASHSNWCGKAEATHPPGWGIERKDRK